MKQLITFCLLLCSCGLFAQNWTVFPYDQASWFEFENEAHYSQSIYYADSLEVNGNTNNYYFHLKYLEDLVGSGCLDATFYQSQTVLFDYLQGKTEDFVFLREPLQETNGQYSFQGNLVFDATLQVGESITISSADYVGLDAVQITCTNQTTMDVYGNMDNVKTFSLQALNGGQAMASDFDNYAYVLSENYGFLEFLPFNELLSTPKTTAKLIGFEDDNGVLQGTKGWVTDAIPYEAGDVIYYEEYFNQEGGNDITYSIDSITSVSISGNNLSYTYYRLSNVDGSASATESTRTISIKFYNTLDKGIYNFDLLSTWGSLYVASLDISQSNFAIEGIPSYNLTLSTDESLIIYSDCTFDGGYFGDTYRYNTQLGLVLSSILGSFTTENWKLLLYRKGNQQIYNSLIAPLEDSYWCTEAAITLGGNNNITYSGVGVENNVFDPYLVPIELYNTPIEITYFLHYDCEAYLEWKEDWYHCYTDTLFLSETVIVNCDVLPCTLSNFTAISSGCDAYGNIVIDVDFDFEGVGAEGFTVMVNGEEYGTYAYQTLSENGTIPIPVNADGSTGFDIFVIDKENATCTTNTVNLASADCTDDVCIFSNVAISSFCELDQNNNNDYIVTLSFDYEGLTSESFAVYRNGDLQGYYSYDEMSQNGFIEIPQPFTWPEVYEFEIVDSLWTACSVSEMAALACFKSACGIENLYFDELTNDICEEDVVLYVDFDHDPNALYDLIWIDYEDTIYREEGVQPPFETSLSQLDMNGEEMSVTLLIVDPENPYCMFYLSYYGSKSENFSDGCISFTTFNDSPSIASNNFYPIYGIEKINNEQDFLINLVFDSFIPETMYHGYTVLVNGVEMGDYRIPEDSEITLGPFPVNETTEYVVELKALAENQTDVKIIDIGVIGSELCSYGDYYIEAQNCNSDGNFSYRIYYDYESESTGYKLYVNGEYYGVDHYGGDYITVGPFFGDGETIYTFDIEDLSGQCSFTVSEVAATCIDEVDINVYAFLEGAYDPTTQTMYRTLGQSGILPTNQPYNTPPWNYNGTESITNFPKVVVVDWVLVEVRSGVPSASGNDATTTVVETQAGLLLTNGQIFNTEGELLRFKQLEYDTPYYICIRHRNHLDVLSATPIIASPAMNYDFRTSPAFGSNQQQTATDGKYVLFGGDYVPDGIIQNSDNDAWKADPAVLNAYMITDGTLDGVVQLTDQDVWLPNKAKVGVVEIRY